MTESCASSAQRTGSARNAPRLRSPRSSIHLGSGRPISAPGIAYSAREARSRIATKALVRCGFEDVT